MALPSNSHEGFCITPFSSHPYWCNLHKGQEMALPSKPHGGFCITPCTPSVLWGYSAALAPGLDSICIENPIFEMQKAPGLHAGVLMQRGVYSTA